MKDRVRISLTLRPEIVSLLDSKVDGTKIRNRSHAVEQFLKQVLVTEVDQAVILIGDQNKALTEICGQTVLERMLDQLQKASINKIVISCTDQSQKIKNLLSSKKFSKFIISYVKNELKGTAHSLRQCKKELNPGNFLFIYGDVLAETDFYDFQDFHKSNNGIATITVTSIPDPLPWGIVRVKRNLVTEFIEKPSPKKVENIRLTNLINAGIFAFKEEIFAYLNEKTYSLEKDVFPGLIKNRQIYSYLLDGVWVNVSSKDLLNHAQKYCKPKK